MLSYSSLARRRALGAEFGIESFLTNQFRLSFVSQNFIAGRLHLPFVGVCLLVQDSGCKLTLQNHRKGPLSLLGHRADRSSGRAATSRDENILGYEIDTTPNALLIRYRYKATSLYSWCQPSNESP